MLLFVNPKVVAELRLAVRMDSTSVSIKEIGESGESSGLGLAGVLIGALFELELESDIMFGDVMLFDVKRTQTKLETLLASDYKRRDLAWSELIC